MMGIAGRFGRKAVDVDGCWCGSPPRYVFVVEERGCVLSGDLHVALEALAFSAINLLTLIMDVPRNPVVDSAVV